MAIPLLGRLSIKEWPLIIISITLAWLEYLISTISSLLPTTVIQLFDLVIKTVYEFTSEPIKLMGYETEGKIKYTRYINSRDSIPRSPSRMPNIT